jgi:hypothetical protein
MCQTTATCALHNLHAEGAVIPELAVGMPSRICQSQGAGHVGKIADHGAA